MKWKGAQAEGFGRSKSFTSVLLVIIMSPHIYTPEGPYPRDPHNAHFKCMLMLGWPPQDSNKI